VVVAVIEQENAGSAYALFNMMSNLGGAIGITALQTFLEAARSGKKLVMRATDAKFSEALCNGVLNGRKLLELVVVPLSGLGSQPAIASFGTKRATPFSATEHDFIDAGGERQKMFTEHGRQRF
jgi:hypothetical protein